jgi:hypothetical protein
LFTFGHPAPGGHVRGLGPVLRPLRGCGHREGESLR